MSDPTENEDLNEELSTEELKSVSGGISQAKLPIGSGNIIRDNDTMLKGNDPTSSGSGKQKYEGSRNGEKPMGNSMSSEQLGFTNSEEGYRHR